MDQDHVIGFLDNKSEKIMLRAKGDGYISEHDLNKANMLRIASTILQQEPKMIGAGSGE